MLYDGINVMSPQGTQGFMVDLPGVQRRGPTSRTKTVRVGKTRFEGRLDVFDVFNATSVRLVTNTFGSA